MFDKEIWPLPKRPVPADSPRPSGPKFELAAHSYFTSFSIMPTEWFMGPLGEFGPREALGAPPGLSPNTWTAVCKASQPEYSLGGCTGLA